MNKRFLALALTAILLSLQPQTSSYAQTAKAATSAAKPVAATKLNPVAVKSAEDITAEQMKDYLTFIASDELEGRNTPSRGLDTAAKFIAALLSRWGYKPAGDEGTYFQRIPLRRTKVDAATSGVDVGGQKYKFGADFLASPSAVKASAPIVYVGEGWLIQSKNIDAYQGVDVKGKFVVVYGNDIPLGAKTFEELNLSFNDRGKTWADPVTYARSKGAAGVIRVATPSYMNNWFKTMQGLDRYGLENRQGAQQQPQTPQAGFVSITISPNMARSIFQGEAKNPFNDASVTAFDLSADKKADINLAVSADTTYTQNVVATLEGSDPKLKSEYVAIGAHYDHVGMNATAAPGTDGIFNGADDDGSGTVSILAMAEAFAKSKIKPKRSIIFVWHCGEEKGLWGSRYFADNPTVPIQSIVTQLNIDMIGRSKKEGDTTKANEKLTGPNEIYIIGTTMMSTTLGGLAKSVNEGYLKLTYNPLYDAPNDPERIFYRSDHFNYARKGIPILFFFDGVHEDYHRPGDEVQKIDFQKMEKIARTVYILAWSVANLPSRPAVDIPLPQQLQNR